MNIFSMVDKPSLVQEINVAKPNTSIIDALANASFKNDEFIQHIYSRVLETIEKSDSVPGLKAEEFKSLKAGIGEYWNELFTNGVIEKTATDAEVRPYFVALQGIIEHVLSNELGKTVKALTGVIHTPMPATPLCTAGDVSSDLVDSTIEEDPLRLFTVKARTTILRDYLSKGGDLYIVYPEEGMSKRTEVQQEIYKRELEKYPVHLLDTPMSCPLIENELVGAFYVFKSKISNGEGDNEKAKQYIFAIKMSQANNPQDSASFGLWFGESRISSPAFGRMVDVLNFTRHYTSRSISVDL